MYFNQVLMIPWWVSKTLWPTMDAPSVRLASALAHLPERRVVVFVCLPPTHPPLPFSFLAKSWFPKQQQNVQLTQPQRHRTPDQNVTEMRMHPSPL